MSEKNRQQCVTVYGYIDESGGISKDDDGRFFIIAIVMTEQPKELAKAYRRGIDDVVKTDDKLRQNINRDGKLKGSELTEAQKMLIYKKLADEAEHTELCLVVADGEKFSDDFHREPGLAFNFLLKSCLEKYSEDEENSSKKLKLFIDERNVGEKSRHSLGDYLNIELVLDGGEFSEDIETSYFDSKQQPIIQLADNIANTALRYYEKTDNDAEQNMNFIEQFIAKNGMFYYP